MKGGGCGVKHGGDCGFEGVARVVCSLSTLVDGDSECNERKEWFVEIGKKFVSGFGENEKDERILGKMGKQYQFNSGQVKEDYAFFFKPGLIINFETL